MQTCIQAEKISGATDAAQIQNAIVEAKKSGTNRVRIPRHNDRTGADIWNIDRTIFLPDDIELLIDNAHLRLADGVFCNMFANENLTKEISRTSAGEQKKHHAARHRQRDFRRRHLQRTFRKKQRKRRQTAHFGQHHTAFLQRFESPR